MSLLKKLTRKFKSCPCGRDEKCEAYKAQMQRTGGAGYSPYPCGVVEMPDPKKSDSKDQPPMRGYGKPPKSK